MSTVLIISVAVHLHVSIAAMFAYSVGYVNSKYEVWTRRGDTIRLPVYITMSVDNSQPKPRGVRDTTGCDRSIAGSRGAGLAGSGIVIARFRKRYRHSERYIVGV